MMSRRDRNESNERANERTNEFLGFLPSPSRTTRRRRVVDAASSPRSREKVSRTRARATYLHHGHVHDGLHPFDASHDRFGHDARRLKSTASSSNAKNPARRSRAPCTRRRRRRRATRELCRTRARSTTNSRRFLPPREGRADDARACVGVGGVTSRASLRSRCDEYNYVLRSSAATITRARRRVVPLVGVRSARAPADGDDATLYRTGDLTAARNVRPHPLATFPLSDARDVVRAAASARASPRASRWVFFSRSASAISSSRMIRSSRVEESRGSRPRPRDASTARRHPPARPTIDRAVPPRRGRSARAIARSTIPPPPSAPTRRSTLSSEPRINDDARDRPPPLGRLSDAPSLRRSDDEDPVDIRPELEEACKPKCAKFVAAYDACVERVAKDTTGEAHCTGQYFDLWGCVDKCVAPTLFKHTK